MNKRIFSLLMAVALVLTFVPVAPVEAEAAAITTCPCCGKALTEITWKELPALTSSSSEAERLLDGHYKVPEGGVTEGIHFQADNTAGTSTGITIDLNGQKIDRGNGVVWSLNQPIQMHVFDSSAAQTGEVHGRTYYDGGIQVTWHSGKLSGITGSVSGGAVYMKGSATTVTVKSGLITGGHVHGKEGSTNVSGGNVYIASGTFNLEKDATISNGITGKPKIMDGETQVQAQVSNNNGGNVDNRGTLNINGGTITGGISYCHGGNIMNFGTVNLKDGGKITNGQAIGTYSDVVGYGGGNIHNRKTLNIIDGEISGGHAAQSGGNIYAHSNTITMSKGTISGGTADKRGQNIYAKDGAILNFNGGTIAAASAANVWLAPGGTTTVNLDGNFVCPQLYLEGDDAKAAKINVNKDFAGNVNIRYTQTSGVLSQLSTPGTEFPANLTADTAYGDTGIVKASDKALAVSNGKFYVPAKLDLSVNHYDPELTLPGTNKTSGWYTKTNFLNEEALWAYYGAYNKAGISTVIRVDPASDRTDLEVPENGLQNGAVEINLNGLDHIGITAPETAAVKVWSGENEVVYPTIYSGMVPAVFTGANGELYISETDEFGSVAVYHVSVGVAAYLRTKKETIAFQGHFEANTAVAGKIEAMGMKLYKTETGEEMTNIKYAENSFTADAVNTLQTAGEYKKAYVAIDSEGDKNNWWTEDITATAYVVINGQTYESKGKTVNYKEAVETMHNNAEYYETVAAMIENTTHEGAYEGWNLVKPEAAA